MGTFEEFMALMAKKRAEESAEEKYELGGGLTTSDNKKVDGNLFKSVRILLSGCSNHDLGNIGQNELFDRLTENFVKANTNEDIKQFVFHHVALKIAKTFAP